MQVDNDDSKSPRPRPTPLAALAADARPTCGASLADVVRFLLRKARAAALDHLERPQPAGPLRNGNGRPSVDGAPVKVVADCPECAPEKRIALSGLDGHAARSRSALRPIAEVMVTWPQPAPEHPAERIAPRFHWRNPPRVEAIPLREARPTFAQGRADMHSGRRKRADSACSYRYCRSPT